MTEQSSRYHQQKVSFSWSTTLILLYIVWSSTPIVNSFPTTNVPRTPSTPSWNAQRLQTQIDFRTSFSLMIRPKPYFATRIFDKSTHQQDYDNDKDEPMATREVIFVPPGKEIESLSSDIWDEIDGAQPSRWWILKEILGIGPFTYTLAILIIIMLSLNAILGPGWLGQSMGLSGTGSFTETSSSLPSMVDLGESEYLWSP